MKIKVADGIVVDVETTQTMVCPAGTAYWQVDYLVGGQCIHSATTGAIHGRPDVVAMLDRVFTRSVTHYQDIPNANPVPKHTTGRKIRQGISGNRPAWWEDFDVTHRQAIIEAYSQLVQE